MQVFDVLLDPPLNLVTLHLTDTIKSYKNKAEVLDNYIPPET